MILNDINNIANISKISNSYNIINIANIRLQIKENNGTYINTLISSLGPVPNAEISPRSLHLGRVPGLKSMYLCMFLYLSLILIILLILIVLIISIILGWSLRTRPKCRDLGAISAFGTGPRLEINVFMCFPLFKPNIAINNVIE